MVFQAEHDALGFPFPPTGRRVDLLEDALEILPRLFRENNVTHEGKQVSVRNATIDPKPVQQPIPIWVGGESGPAMRRTAKYGDAWYPIGTNPQFPMDTLNRFKAGAAKLAAMTEKAGRDPKAVGLAYRVSSNPEAQPKGTVDGQRKLFTGGAEDWIGDIKSLRDVGVTSFDFGLFGPTLSATIDNMRKFRDTVVAKVR